MLVARLFNATKRGATLRRDSDVSVGRWVVSELRGGAMVVVLFRDGATMGAVQWCDGYCGVKRREVCGVSSSAATGMV